MHANNLLNYPTTGVVFYCYPVLYHEFGKIMRRRKSLRKDTGNYAGESNN